MDAGGRAMQEKLSGVPRRPNQHG